MTPATMARSQILATRGLPTSKPQSPPATMMAGRARSCVRGRLYEWWKVELALRSPTIMYLPSVCSDEAGPPEYCPIALCQSAMGSPFSQRLFLQERSTEAGGSQSHEGAHPGSGRAYSSHQRWGDSAGSVSPSERGIRGHCFGKSRRCSGNAINGDASICKRPCSRSTFHGDCSDASICKRPCGRSTFHGDCSDASIYKRP